MKKQQTQPKQSPNKKQKNPPELTNQWKVKQVKRAHALIPGAKYYEKPRLSQPLQLHVENARLP